MKTLYEIGQHYQNDKITHHRYDLTYSMFLEPLRNNSFNLLEIGLGDNTAGTGKSNYLWKEYFPNCILYIMDINHEYNDGLCQVIKGDQSKQEDLEKVKNIIQQSDIIIDDGSHHPIHQLNTFLYFFENLLNYGGYYIIEDIECSYWNPKSKVYGYETGHFNIIDYFKNIPHQINDEFSNIKNTLNISNICFGKNCIIIKKQTEEEIELNKREYRFKHLL